MKLDWTPSEEGQRSIAGRLRLFRRFIVGAVALYGVYLFGMQIVNGSTYRHRATEVASREVVAPAQRGQIFDRNYDSPLVLNEPSFAVAITPGTTGSGRLDDVVARLSSLLGRDRSELRAKFPSSPLAVFQPVLIESGVPYSTIAYLAEHVDDFPGVSWHSRPIRAYAHAESLSHVIGYVGDITREELQVLYNQGYEAGTTIGKAGVEKVYDSLLRGIDGKTLSTVDVRGRDVATAESDDIPPVNGKNIVLTIDRGVQELAQKALGEHIGSVVVLKPASGEVLAMVSYPWYDPNLFLNHTDRGKVRELFLDPNFPFLNRAIQSTYAPASTFKIIMSAADLEENALPPSRSIDCQGSMVFGNRIWHDWQPTGHGPVNLQEALAESCDVYFWTLGSRYLGVDRIVEYAERFGLGRKTGIDLPGEVEGLVPSPEWKERTQHAQWLGGDTMNISIGQGNLLVTPLQLADAVAMVVNSGTIYAPHVLKEVRDPTTGAVIQSVKPRLLRSSGVGSDTFRKLRADMRSVISSGTANVVITTKAVKIAGKTGTGEVGKKEHFTSWFASFGPYDSANPEDQIVVVVMIEATNDWDWWAPKAANIIYQGYFAHQSYEQAVNTLVQSASWYLKPIRINDR